jgi:hypothetical protein
MDDSRIHVCIAVTPEGDRHYVTVLPPDVVFERGLAAEAIVGVLLRPPEPGEQITSDNFARNSVFVKFMHDVIARHAPDAPAFKEEAARQGTGWVYIIDARTKTPTGDVPLVDILGGFQVEEGTAKPGSYWPNPNHTILSPDGFFRLNDHLHACPAASADL